MFLVVLKDNTEIVVNANTIMPTEDSWYTGIDTDDDTFRLVDENDNNIFICHYSDVKYFVKK